ncbi:Uncharacterized protein APZ42_023102 [Daphnia magna]|uniref:Reverse transcriptase domain-containing protein n=1 Tax=Daphnia magna TaxID=35525 RepID=A0A164V6D5_9CRUS|nr:Uncharacterized protein APZ42_023102 [Daphnia magna]
MFSSISRSSKLYPAVALFVDLDLLPGLKNELILRNAAFKRKIDSVTQIKKKTGSNKGHVKLIFLTQPPVWWLLLDREVRQCFNCQGYGHSQASCRSTSPLYGKCAESHRTRDCMGAAKKCANCSGAHEDGDRFCNVQMKAVASGTSFLDITLGTDDTVTPHWFFPTFPSLSDHPFIYYEIMRATSPCSARLLKAPSPKLPHITKLDVLHLRSLVSMGLSHTPLPTLACSKSEVDSSISGLVSLFFSLVRKAKKKDDPTPTRLMPWWNKELCPLRYKTRQAFKLWSVLKTRESRDRYSRCKANYQRELRRAKSHSWQQLCASKPSGSDLFLTLKLLAGKSNSIALPPSIRFNGESITDPSAVLNKCAIHFFPSEPPSLPVHSLVTEFITEKLLVPSVSPFPPVTLWELSSAVKSLNPKASPGQDGLSMAIIKECFPALKLRLLCILNDCFSLQYFPNCWKTSKVVIIGKPNKSNYDCLESFRPISLVINLTKILEKVFLSRLQWHACQLKGVSSNQHGFTAGKSTETASHTRSFKKRILRNKQQPLLSLTSKVPLTRRCTRPSSHVYSNVVVHYIWLDWSHVSCPVAQPSCLTMRFLFPFPHLSIGYADDLTISTFHKIPELATRNLQLMCNAISSWCSDTKLSLNA